MDKDCIRHTIDSLGMESPASDVSFKTMVAFTFDLITTVKTIWHQEAAVLFLGVMIENVQNSALIASSHGQTLRGGREKLFRRIDCDR